MKLILLAAAAMIAVPAIAQTTTPDADTSTQTATPTDQSTTQTPTTDQSGTMQTPPTTDQSMQSGTMPAPSSAPMNGTMSPSGTMPAPGTTMTVQPSMSPAQAFPPPPAETGPLPFCKAGQYDKCREHSTPSGARSHRTPR